MQNVSEEYIESMNSPMREIGYKKVTFGTGSRAVTFENIDIIDSNLSTSCSPMTMTLPQIDFWVKLDNADHRFDIDYFATLVGLFAKETPVLVYDGYATPGADDIEWLEPWHLYVDEFSVDEESCTVRCVDVLRLAVMNEMYVPSLFPSTPMEFLENVIEDLSDRHGIELSYEVDETLEAIEDNIAGVALKKVSYKELIQQIANAAFAMLTIKRDGTLRFADWVADPSDRFEMARRNMTSRPVASRNKIRSITFNIHKMVPNFQDVNSFYTVTQVDKNVVIDSPTWSKEYEFDEPTFIGSPYQPGIGDIVPSIGGYQFSLDPVYDNGTYRAKIVLTQYTTLPVTLDLRIYEQKALFSDETIMFRVGNDRDGEDLVIESPIRVEHIPADFVPVIKIMYRALSGFSYDYSTRGNPELDMGEFATQDNPFVRNMGTLLTGMSLGFNGAWSGLVHSYRVPDDPIIGSRIVLQPFTVVSSEAKASYNADDALAKADSATTRIGSAETRLTTAESEISALTDVVPTSGSYRYAGFVNFGSFAVDGANMATRLQAVWDDIITKLTNIVGAASYCQFSGMLSFSAHGSYSVIGSCYVSGMVSLTNSNGSIEIRHFSTPNQSAAGESPQIVFRNGTIYTKYKINRTQL